MIRFGQILTDDPGPRKSEVVVIKTCRSRQVPRAEK